MAAMSGPVPWICITRVKEIDEPALHRRKQPLVEQRLGGHGRGSICAPHVEFRAGLVASRRPSYPPPTLITGDKGWVEGGMAIMVMNSDSSWKFFSDTVSSLAM